MSFYRNRVYPQLVSVLGNPAPVRNIRKRLIAMAEGDVLEIGVGPGVNFAYYDARRVRKLYGLEPNPGMILRAKRQCLGTGLDVEFLGLHGECIPLADRCVDTIVTTFTLCTIPGVAEAIQGMRRVLKCDGRLIFWNTGSRPTCLFGAGRSERNLCSNGHSPVAT